VDIVLRALGADGGDLDHPDGDAKLELGRENLQGRPAVSRNGGRELYNYLQRQARPVGLVPTWPKLETIQKARVG
jgi:hypothetical protein